MGNKWRLLLQDYVVANLKADALPSAMTLDWAMKFAITTWWIWRWRNAMIFNNKGMIPNDPIAFVFTRFTENSKALELDELVFRDPKFFKLGKPVK